ncbi:MAG: heme-binding protein, partial [Xanthobacteraceae bacterium]
MRTKHALTSADVKTIIAACEAEAAKNNWAVAISVLDDSGVLLGFVRMDGAPRISGEVSIGKARTSAMTGRPSKFFRGHGQGAAGLRRFSRHSHP